MDYLNSMLREVKFASCLEDLLKAFGLQIEGLLYQSKSTSPSLWSFLSI